MVERKQVSGFESMVKHKRGICQIIFFIFLTPWDLARFARVNKSCYKLLDPKSKHCVNYEVLYLTWGMKLKPSQIKET